jgi:CO/xanthine dehydrogenase Mo-binding subunit
MEAMGRRASGSAGGRGALGESLPRLDAVEKVTGAARYGGDVDLPGQAFLKVVFAGVPHATIQAVEVEAARAAPGVLAVLTAADVPQNEYGLIMRDQPVLCGTGSTEQARTIRWEADHVAVVVAETQAQAEAAAKLVKLQVEPLPVLTDPFDAMAPGAPILHPRAFKFPYGERDLRSNVLLEYKLLDGDIHAGFAAADVVVESVYRTHSQEHAYLQPEAGAAWVRPDGKVEIICGGQWMHEEREQVAHALGLPEEQVVVRFPAIGGAFGGREDISVQIVLALAAIKTGRPVKIVWSREESIVGHHKRHPFTIHARWGATRAGEIVAAQVDMTSDCGAYAYTSTKVLGNALLAVLGPYKIPHVQVTARTVYTNNTPSGAFRGFGGPQGHFAAEMQVNKLAALLGMDPVELRMRNLWREGDRLPTRSVLPAGVTARETLAAAAVRAGWHEAGQAQGGDPNHRENHRVDGRETAHAAGAAAGAGEWRRAAPVPGGKTDGRTPAADGAHGAGPTGAQTPAVRTALTSLEAAQEAAQEAAPGGAWGTERGADQGVTATGVGIAVCFKNIGFSLGAPEHCYAVVELYGDREIERAVVACVGADVGQGAHGLFRQVAAAALALDPARVEVRAEHTELTGSSGSASASRMSFMAGNAIKGAAERALAEWENEERPARAEFVFRPRPTTGYNRQTGEADPNITYGYCAQAAEVAVDRETGHVTVKRLVSANDVGKAVNPQQIEGQVEGAVAQAVGWALIERYVQKEGKAVTQHLSTYLIPTVLDVAEVVEPVILEIPDPQGPFGLRGMAEMPMIPTAAAIGAAIFAATGVWIDELPYTPERVWKALQGRL